MDTSKLLGSAGASAPAAARGARAAMAAFALAGALMAAGCQTPLRSAIYGDLGPGRVGSTVLRVPEGYRSVTLEGELGMSSGAATVRLTVPDGSATVFELRAGASGLPESLQVGPHSSAAAAGDWTVTVEGGALAAGTYSVSLEAR